MPYVYVPSETVDKLYEIMDEYIFSSSEYYSSAITAVRDYLEEHNIYYTEEQIGDAGGGSYAVSWIEQNNPVLIIFNYINA
jgi:hypothetical protein